MGEWDDLFSVFQQADEQRKRRNFDAFMKGFNGGLVYDLDNAYASGDMEKYNRLVTNIKNNGIKIFRNSEGKHKLKYI